MVIIIILIIGICIIASLAYRKSKQAEEALIERDRQLRENRRARCFPDKDAARIQATLDWADRSFRLDMEMIKALRDMSDAIELHRDSNHSNGEANPSSRFKNPD